MEARMSDYKKLLKMPYRFRKSALSIFAIFSLRVYNFIIRSIEFLMSFVWVNTFFRLYSVRVIYREKPLVLVCRNNFHNSDGDQVSLEKFMMDDTLKEVDVEVDIFFWDDETNILGNHLSWCRKIIELRPDVVILSSYSVSNITHPRLSLLNVLRKKYKIKFVAIWYDTCTDNFIDFFQQHIKNIDLNVFLDNPMMDIGKRKLTENEKSKCIGMWTPANAINFNPQEEEIDVAFLGQIGSYRSYRKETLFFLMKSNIAGFYSAFEKNSQLSHEEYFDILGKAKIGINFSYSVDKHQLKGRVFDTMLSGALLLEQENSQIECCFNDGEDYVSFSSKEDLLNKIKYYLANDDERKKIARSGRMKCLDLYNGKSFWKVVFEKVDIL
jgi:hypothetical protein